MKILSAKNPSNIKKAAQILAQGGIGAFPTETVYGLGADALNLKAVAKVFEAKGRPVLDPLIVHVAGIKEAEMICRHIPKEARRLMQKFWPGPLTFILPKKNVVPDLVTAGLDTVAIRVPKHPVALKLLRALKTPIAAPSANRFGFISTTDAYSVADELGEKIDFVLDGGPATIGVESTILKLQSDRCELLRPGGIPIEEIRRCLPQKKIVQVKHRMYESPGRMAQHYATRTPLIYLNTLIDKIIPEIEKIQSQCAKRKISFPRMGFLGVQRTTKTSLFSTEMVLSRKGDMREAAAHLFSTMRKLDRQNLKLIVAEEVPQRGLGLAIADRLKRASVGDDLLAILRKKIR